MVGMYGVEQILHCVGGFISAAALYIIGVWLVATGQAWAMFVLPILLSPFAAFAVRKWIEEISTKGMFSLDTQSMAFVLGDTFVLPFAFLFVTIGWSQTGFADSAWMLFGAFVAGFVVAIAFRLFDRSRYQVSTAAQQAFHSPTKLWHDLGLYPVLAGLMIWAVGPQLVQDRTVWTGLTFMCLAVWLLLGFIDMKNQPNPEDQHPAWNVKDFHAV